MKGLAVLGSTGSVGTQTLDIVRSFPDDFHVVALAARRSIDLLADQVSEFRPSLVSCEGSREEKAALFSNGCVESSVEDMVRDDNVDLVVNAIVGDRGLDPTLAAIRAGKDVALANKESVVMGGEMLTSAAEGHNARLLPVDSEPNAIWQCLRGEGDQVARLILTASGGAFRNRPPDELANVTPEEALDHPTWTMGQKVTVDSSTLMNKGLEVIEAHELFGIDYDRIDVVVHPQSIVHSMVTFSDGATIAQLSNPDMRLCIGYALAWPDRLDVSYGEIDWSRLDRLDFEPPDRQAFPCLGLAFAAGREGETAPAWLNAANEVAVEAFLDGTLSWVGISELLAEALDAWPGDRADDVDTVLDVDRRARVAARALVAARA